MNDTWWIDAGDLDNDQTEIVSLDPDESFLVFGPPGSGKTNLLLLRASYLSDSGKGNIAVLTFTRSLRDFAARGASNYPGLSVDDITTITKWEMDILKEHEVNFEPLPDDFVQMRAKLAAELTSLLERKPRLRGIFDCILVDEVQDCTPDEIALFFKLAQNVFFVGDPRQRIYQVTDALSDIGATITTKTLRFHYRNGRAICRLADGIGRTIGFDPVLPSCNYKEEKAPSSAERVQATDINGQIAELLPRLASQLVAYPDELLGVLCPRKRDAEIVRQALEKSELEGALIANEHLSLDDGPGRIFISTFHSAKGLEFRAVHLMATEFVTRLRQVQKRLAYMAVTRAKTSLTVYYTGNLPGYFRSGFQEIEGPPEPPSIKNLFRRRS